MTLWARLTWQADDPRAWAASLATQLGVVASAGGGAPGSWSIDLGTAVLEIRGWVRESATDEPLPGGRLVLEPVPGGEEPPADGGAPLVLAGVGWATVELDRAEQELDAWLGERAHGGPEPEDPPEPHLGARTRARPAGGLPGEHLVFLEPSTEGRLAASLARDGEGPAALYLRPQGGLATWQAAARARGVLLTSRRAGPLGASVLVLGGPVAGPHLLLVDAPRPSKRKAGASTIAP